MNSRKAQVGIVGAIFIFIFFLINWFVWLGTWVGNIGASVVAEQGLTGVEAFFISNLNFVILIGMILGMMGWIYFSSPQ